MRADAPAAPRSTATSLTARAAAPPGAFGAALARARGSPALLAQAGAPAAGALGAGALTLERRRCDADGAQRKLGQRRDEAEPEKGGSPGAAGRASQTCAEPSRPEGSAAAALLPASAVERLALEVGRMAGRPFVDMSFGRDLHIRIMRSPRGVELLLTPRAELRGAATAELPGLVAALRARGVPVARAEVRAGEAGAAGPGALTPRWTSATTAATPHPGGTVAKW